MMESSSLDPAPHVTDPVTGELGHHVGDKESSQLALRNILSIELLAHFLGFSRHLGWSEEGSVRSGEDIARRRGIACKVENCQLEEVRNIEIFLGLGKRDITLVSRRSTHVVLAGVRTHKTTVPLPDNANLENSERIRETEGAPIGKNGRCQGSPLHWLGADSVEITDELSNLGARWKIGRRARDDLRGHHPDESLESFEDVFWDLNIIDVSKQHPD